MQIGTPSSLRFRTSLAPSRNPSHSPPTPVNLLGSMVRRQDPRGVRTTPTRHSGPSWLIVQVLAASFGVTLIAAVLLPIATGIRLKRVAEESESISAALSGTEEHVEMLEQENLELRASGGNPDMFVEVQSLRRDRDELMARIEGMPATLEGSRPGPDLQSVDAPPVPVDDILARTPGLAIVADLDDKAVEFGIAAGPLSFSMQREIQRLLPQIAIGNRASTVLEVGVRVWTWEGQTDAGIVSTTLDLTQPRRRSEDAAWRISLWHESSPPASNAPRRRTPPNSCRAS